jgi:hypothetical protein
MLECFLHVLIKIVFK